MNFSASTDYHGDGRYMQHVNTMQHIHKITFRPEDAVLDVGCGTGEETKSIAGKVKSVTGIDNSEEMLALARTRNPAPNLTYLYGDARDCGVNPDLVGRFDKAVSFFVLHWLPGPAIARALRGILACLKRGGEALFILANRTPVTADADQFLKSHPEWGKYVKDYKSSYNPWNQTETGMEKLLTACGWTNVQCELYPVTTSLNERRTKLLFKTAALGQTALIPEREQEAYLEDMWQWALSRYQDPAQAGHVVFPKENAVVRAVKPQV
ncbi:ubiquinone biosynthesis O-methyltransferase-like [Patiria miniata]|uniref:Methyltransferase domain-containing protein n=1 Tax=Patiria miniata TaxID=46514 RepID=A0A914BG49_PATMI|nr:ubiquinone biosynthesis O-methyltransferase-like [Patiria miniata]